MSERVGEIAVIAPEPDRRCELCGKLDECRPYGPNGEQICCECGDKNPETTKRMMRLKLFGMGNA